jgi:hypothetical protein
VIYSLQRLVFFPPDSDVDSSSSITPSSSPFSYKNVRNSIFKITFYSNYILSTQQKVITLYSRYWKKKSGESNIYEPIFINQFFLLISTGVIFSSAIGEHCTVDIRRKNWLVNDKPIFINQFSLLISTGVIYSSLLEEHCTVDIRRKN